MPYVNVRVEGEVAAVYLCRGNVNRESASITEFVDIWYSEATCRNLQEIRIR